MRGRRTRRTIPGEMLGQVQHRTQSMTQSEVSVQTVGGDLVAVGRITSRTFH
jgi:hypothetical protein